MITKKLLSALSVASMLATTLAPIATHAATTTAFGPGDLIKGTTVTTVYYFAPDGRRYVFPNEKTYFTWYKDFTTVKTIPDGLLQTLPLGRSNVTYRPGVKMVKITTDPKTYVVDQGGVLRHVGSEQLAETLFGLSWKNRIDDVPDAYFTNYKVGTAIQTASDYSPAGVMTNTTTIAQDKQFDETTVTISLGTVSNGFVPSSITIKKGSTVVWQNTDSAVHVVKGAWGQSQDLKYNDTYSRKFDTTGSFDFSDAIYPVMQGTVNVVN
jgi:plastocyanin